MGHASTARILDAELRQRGTTLQDWALTHGVAPTRLVGMLEGAVHPEPHVLLDLEELTGVSPKHFVSP